MVLSASKELLNQHTTFCCQERPNHHHRPFPQILQAHPTPSFFNTPSPGLQSDANRIKCIQYYDSWTSFFLCEMGIIGCTSHKVLMDQGMTYEPSSVMLWSADMTACGIHCLLISEPQRLVPHSVIFTQRESVG